jgi:hypothetical protein
MSEERKFYYNGVGQGYCGSCLEGIIEESPEYYSEVDKSHDHYGMLVCENCGIAQHDEIERRD